MFVCGQKPVLMGLILGVSTLHRKVCKNGKQLICGKISETIKILKFPNDSFFSFFSYAESLAY